MTTGTEANAGQANANPGTAAAPSMPASGTTAAAPSSGTGTPGSTAQTTGNGPEPSATAIESFFDPASIAGKPELELAYKQMQAQFTKRMQAVAKDKTKVEAYDRFQSDPLGVMRQIAAQYGYQFVQGPPNGGGNGTPEAWNPQSWDDVMARAKELVLEEMKPVFDEVRGLKKQNIETYMDSKYADWRTYETEMMETLRAHPSLVGDPDKLYRLSVPPEVLEARATKAAMARLQATTQQSQVSGPSTTQAPTSAAPTGPMSFQQAVEHAKKQLAAKGLTRPAA